MQSRYAKIGREIFSEEGNNNRSFQKLQIGGHGYRSCLCHRSLALWRVLNTMEVLLSGGYSEGLRERLRLRPIVVNLNDAFRNNFLDHNLNIISQTVLQKF